MAVRSQGIPARSRRKRFQKRMKSLESSPRRPAPPSLSKEAGPRGPSCASPRSPATGRHGPARLLRPRHPHPRSHAPARPRTRRFTDMCTSLFPTRQMGPKDLDPRAANSLELLGLRDPQNSRKSSTVRRGHVLGCGLRCRATPLGSQVCPGPVRPGRGFAFASLDGRTRPHRPRLPGHQPGPTRKERPRRPPWPKAGATERPRRGRASRVPRPVPAAGLGRARGNWVGREATGGRRLQRDYAPVSRNLSKWTGQAGRLWAGVREASAPTPARPGTAGEPGPAAERGWLAPRLREARARPGRRGREATLCARPSHTHTTREDPHGASAAGDTHRATHSARARPGPSCTAAP